MSGVTARVPRKWSMSVLVGFRQVWGKWTTSESDSNMGPTLIERQVLQAITVWEASGKRRDYDISQASRESP